MDSKEIIVYGSGMIVSCLFAVPYLYKIYDIDFDEGSGRTWMRLILFFLGVMAGASQLLALLFKHPTYKWILLSQYAVVGIYAIYYICMGIPIASLQLNYDVDNMSMVEGGTFCGKVDDIESYQSAMYITSIFMLIVVTVSLT